VPGYVVAQFVGATLAVLFLQPVIDVSASNGATYPAESTTHLAAFLMEVALTLGLVSLILGTASGAQNVGVLGAGIAVLAAFVLRGHGGGSSGTAAAQGTLGSPTE
jgi:aquaporin Z